MQNAKIWILKIENGQNWLFIKQENGQTLDLKISNKEYEYLKQKQVPTSEDILEKNN